MFSSLNFIKPIWYFHLDSGEKTIWPDPESIVSSELLDKGYNSIESMVSEASYLALTSGYIQNFSNKKYLPRRVVKYNHTAYDEFRFLKKFFNPFWSVVYLLYRIITLQNIFNSILAFIKTVLIKRVDVKYKFFSNKKLEHDKSSILKNSKNTVRIIIPTYNRYSPLNNLLKDLENQIFSNFKVSIVDQSENYDKQFYEKYNLQIDLHRQKSPGLWKARNNAICNTTESIIALLDDDSRIKKDWLLNHLKCLEYFKIDISAGVSRSESGSKVPHNYYFYRVSDQIDTGNVIIRRKIFNKCGLFDEKFEGMRMGDAEFGLRTFQKGIIAISNPEAYRVHLKTSRGGLRQLGSWDAFRPTSIFKPRPIPSVLYFSRKYFGDYNALIFLLINLPISLSKYSKKDVYFYSFFSLLIFLIFSPIILSQALISWKISSKMLGRKHSIPNEK